MLRVHLPGPETSLMLINRTLTERTATSEIETAVPGDEALLDVLARRFRLCLPPGTRIPIEAS